jgi:hypothetical protein
MKGEKGNFGENGLPGIKSAKGDAGPPGYCMVKGKHSISQNDIGSFKLAAFPDSSATCSPGIPGRDGRDADRGLQGNLNLITP